MVDDLIDEGNRSLLKMTAAAVIFTGSITAAAIYGWRAWKKRRQ